MKIGLISLGCPKNLVDSEVMLGLAQNAGHELTRDAADADVLVVNTCAFIDKAKQESVDTILEMAEHKKDGRCRRLVVTGCLAERYRDELREQIPEIDALLGTGEVEQIVGAIGARDPGLGARDSGRAELKPGAAETRFLPLLRADGQPLNLERVSGSRAPSPEPRTPSPGSRAPGPEPRIPSPGSRAPSPEPRIPSPGSRAPSPEPRIPSPGSRAPGPEPRIPSPGPRVPSPEPRIPSPGSRPTYLYDASTPRLLATPRHYAYVKIAEGCDYKCAFCIIPTLRGAYRSRSIESVVAEARTLAANGTRELLLISQDTSFFGVDRGERGALARLLRRLNDVEGLRWIRMLYLYPTTIGDDVLDAMADCEKVCNYIDLPLQHAADVVLKRMKRPGTRASYERLLDRIRRRLPEVTLRTTFIVGYPGETEANFAELQSFVAATGFDHVGVFTYSHEEGTSGYLLTDDVAAATKRARRSALMSLQRRLVTKALRSRVGDHVQLMVDGPSSEHELVLRGRMASQAPDIDSCVYLTETDPSAIGTGALITAEIVGVSGYDLLARPLETHGPA
ncbi:MAG TPA: MiaB/RimO family radical SAM methylthiotransferase [Vicinamibacterales bacterium]|nr:MiaB/RimO family radical SAM methylthiotransferase [Vicinamibacterales bacterium]